MTSTYAEPDTRQNDPARSIGANTGRSAAGRRRDEASRQDLVAGYRALCDSREQYMEADHFYAGEVGAPYASPRIQKLLARGGVQQVEDLNYAKIPVDVVATRLQVASVIAAPAEEDDGDQGDAEENAAVKAATKAIARLRKRNELDAEEKHLHHLASKHGEAYLLVWPVTEGGKVVDVDMRVNCADQVRIMYDEEDPLVPAYAIKAWEVEPPEGADQQRKKTHRANLYYFGTTTSNADTDGDRGADGRQRAGSGRIERWVTEPGKPPEKADSWRRVTDLPYDIEPEDVEYDDEFDTDEGVIPNPYGKIWFHFRNDRPYGCPEHRSAYGPQRLINKLVDADAAVIDFQTFPQRYLLVDPMLDDPHLNMEDPEHPDLEEDDPETETGTSGLRADPASVWRLWGKAVGQFEPADAHTFLDRFDRYIKSMAELTDTPQYAFTKASGDVPSGEALREMNRSMYDKVKDRQDRYDPVWQDAYELALKMMGIERVTVDVRWKPVEVINDSSGWQVVGLKTAAGVPNQIALEETGYPKDQVETWLEDMAGADMQRRVALLEQLGTAAQAFAAAVQLGVIAETTVQTLFDRFLRLTAEGTEDPKDSEAPLPAATFRDPPPTNPAEAQAKAAQDFPAPPPKLAVDHTGKVPENPGLMALKMGTAKNASTKPNGRKP